MKPYIEAKSAKELCKLLNIPLSEAAKIEMRTNLVISIKRVIERKNMTHEKAAKMAKVGRTVITAIVNGNLDKISTDRLIDVAQELGLTVQIKIAG